MRAFIYIGIFVFFGLNTISAQKVLSKKEIRKQRKIEQLQTYIKEPKFRFLSSTISSSTGKRMGSRGGFIDINGDTVIFHELLTQDINDNIEILTLEFDLENYTTIGSLKDDNFKIFFSGYVINNKCNFKFNVQKSGRAKMQITGIYGVILNYEGRISSF